jgi:RNA recognition motif-containing protein
VAYITFASPASALSAYESLDKKSFQGRLLHILGAVDRKGGTEAEDVEVKKTVKGDKDAKRKVGAGKEFNWGMLYMNVSWGPSASFYTLQLQILTKLLPERRSGLVGGRSDEDNQIRHLEP